MVAKRDREIAYVCPVCQEQYDPVEAAEINHRCCAVLTRTELIRDQADQEARRYVEPAPSANVALQVIPADINEVVPTMMEQILGTVRRGPLSLELAGTDREQMLIVRGPASAVAHARAQLEAGYGQVGFQELDQDSDPIYGDGGAMVAASTARLRRPAYFPVRTWRQFGGMDDAGRPDGYGPQMADPIRVLVGAMGDLAPGERALVQLVLQERAPEHWADRYQGAAQQVDFRVKAASPAGQMRGGLLALGMVLGFLDVIFACYAGAGVLRYGLSGPVAFRLLVLAFFAGVSAAAAYLGWIAWNRLTTRLNANPDVVRQKVSEPAFGAQLRFWAWSASAERSEVILERLRAAYSVFDLAEGNAFVDGGAVPRDPSDLRSDGLPTMLLNLSEMAGMWHPPVGVVPDRMRREMYYRRIPQQITQAAQDSVEIGRSSKGDEPVYLADAAVESGVFLIGKPQTGKSSVMQLIAAQAMKDPNRAVVVVDPHQDMVEALKGLVPPSRVGQTYCLDLSETGMFPGINLLDMSVGVDADKVVSDLVTSGQALWAQYWGPRMEQVLTYAAKTVALINRERVARGRADEQLNVLFINRLLLAGKEERRKYLAVHLPHSRDADIAELRYWWSTYFDAQTKSFQQEMISPVLSKINRIGRDVVTRSIFGQPVTTLDLREVIRRRGIVLVNSGSTSVGSDVGAFVGALVVNYLDSLIREQARLPREARTPLTALVDEFQSIRDGVSWRDVLGQLRKFGAHVTLGTQSLAGLREDNPYLVGEIFAGVMTTFAFQMNAEDAKYVAPELDEAVPAASLINVEPFHAYLKTVDLDRKRLPTLEVALRDPLERDETVAARIQNNMATYCTPAAEVEGMLQRSRGETIDNLDEEAAENAKLAAAIAESETLIPQNYLLAASAAQGTVSSLNYGRASGQIGRGQKTRRRRAPRPGAVRGYSVSS